MERELCRLHCIWDGAVGCEFVNDDIVTLYLKRQNICKAGGFTPDGVPVNHGPQAPPHTYHRK